MDAVMQLAREASNHQYLPAADQQPSFPNGQDSNNGVPGTDQDLMGEHSAAKETAGSSGSGRARRKTVTNPVAPPGRAGGRKRKMSQSKDALHSPPGDVQYLQDEQVGQEIEQRILQQQHQGATLDDVADAWMQTHTQQVQEQHHQQQHPYDAYTYSENMAGPSNLAAATAAAAAAAAAATSHPHRLPVRDEEEGGPEDHESQRHDNLDEGSPPGHSDSLANRALSTSRRAAQNRAAQRAFRERRDRHVKELETTATQFSQLQTDYDNLQARYQDALALIDHLRRENERLRGGDAEPPLGDEGGIAGLEEPARYAQQVEDSSESSRIHNTKGLEAVASVAAGAARLAAASVRRSQNQQQQPEGGKDAESTNNS